VGGDIYAGNEVEERQGRSGDTPEIDGVRRVPYFRWRLVVTLQSLPESFTRIHSLGCDVAVSPTLEILVSWFVQRFRC